MNSRRTRSQFASGGFSLVEVLVASAVLAVVMTILLSTLTTSLALWRNTEAKAASDREARASALLLHQDLANAVLPANVNLWPRVVTNNGIAFLQLLTTRPPDYQSGAADTGDICYVEYALDPSEDNAGRRLQRLFYGSDRTFREILTPGLLRGGRRGAGLAVNEDFQVLGLNLLPDNRQAVRGFALEREANRSHFVMLSTNHANAQTLPLTGNYTLTNRPVAIEVNFAVADPDTLQNTDLLNNADFVLRNAGLYSTRFFLPPPQNLP